MRDWLHFEPISNKNVDICHKIVSNDFVFWSKISLNIIKFQNSIGRWKMQSIRNWLLRKWAFLKLFSNRSLFVSYDLQNNCCRFRESNNQICRSNVWKIVYAVKVDEAQNSNGKMRTVNCTNNGNSFTFFKYISNRLEYINKKKTVHNIQHIQDIMKKNLSGTWLLQMQNIIWISNRYEDIFLCMQPHRQVMREKVHTQSNWTWDAEMWKCGEGGWFFERQIISIEFFSSLAARLLAHNEYLNYAYACTFSTDLHLFTLFQIRSPNTWWSQRNKRYSDWEKATTARPKRMYRDMFISKANELWDGIVPST